MEKTIREYEKDLKMYVDFLDKIEKMKPNNEIIRTATQGFYNCIAIAGYLSFGEILETMLCLKFIKIAEKFMLLLGLDEAPDEMPWALAAIHHNAIQQYHDLVQAENYRFQGLTEQEYEQKIVSNFSEIEQFKRYEFVNNQVKSQHGDKIDILAKDIVSHRPVIIEIKRGGKSGHKQLRSYAISYKNPVLINVSVQEVKHKRPDIIYHTIDDLFENSEFLEFAELHGQSEILSQQLAIDR